MSTKYRMALGVSPLFLRAALAVTFIWAGLGKIQGTMEVTGEDAAVLANLGVIKPSSAPGTTGTGSGAGGVGSGGTDAGSGPTKPLPPPPDEVKPEGAPEGAGEGGGGRVESGAGEARVVLASMQDQGAPAEASQGAGSAAAPVQAGTYTAADFPDKVTVKQVYLLAGSLYSAAHPKATPEKPAPKAIWPAALASGRLPVIMAWLVVAAELGGGVLVALGLCTRLAAFCLAGVMAGAMWLTQFGPAIASGNALLGFLPNLPRYDMAWVGLLFQFALFAMAMALMFSGPGYMAADHMLFGSRRRGDDHDGE